MNTTTNTSIDFSQLRDQIGGPVVAAGEEGYDAARQAWIANADQHPAAVAFPRSAEDVAAAVRFAAANGLKVAMQGSGHGATATRLRGHPAREDRPPERARRSTQASDVRAPRPACCGAT